MALSLSNLFSSERETEREKATIMQIRPLVRKDATRVEGSSIIDLVLPDGSKKQAIVFDNIFPKGVPVIPAKGLPAVLTIQESEAVDADGNPYTNVVGVQIDVEQLPPIQQAAALGISLNLFG